MTNSDLLDSQLANGHRDHLPFTNNHTDIRYKLPSPISDYCEESDIYPCFNRFTLWSFIFDLLEGKQNSSVRWTDRANLEFKVEDTDGLAKEWGKRKGRNTMTWQKFARAMRYYYGKHVLEKVDKKRFTYRFIDSPKTRPVIHRKNAFHRQQNEEMLVSYTTAPSTSSFTTSAKTSCIPTTTSANNYYYNLMNESENIGLIQRELEISTYSMENVRQLTQTTNHPPITSYECNMIRQQDTINTSQQTFFQFCENRNDIVTTEDMISSMPACLSNTSIDQPMPSSRNNREVFMDEYLQIYQQTSGRSFDSNDSSSNSYFENDSSCSNSYFESELDFLAASLNLDCNGQTN